MARALDASLALPVAPPAPAGGNAWYKKIMVANTRVPIASVAIKRNGQWTSLSAKTSDNYFEYHGEGLLVQVAWRGVQSHCPPSVCSGAASEPRCMALLA